MFRRLTDRISSAASSAFENPNVRTLTSMGFDSRAAANALAATNNNVEQAAELLLAQQSGATASNHDSELQRAMNESLQEDKRRKRTAAMNKAAEAAAQRSSGKRSPTDLTAHHPNVKVIPKLQDKSKEEQILRCADRLKANHVAVDTLHRALTAVRNEPDNQKFRKVDKTTAGYKKSLENVPGAEDLFRAMNYRPSGPNALILDRSAVDPALLYLGISALEQMRMTTEYIESKMKATFAKEIAQIRLQADSSETEALARANFISKCPSEPSVGKGALVQITMANETVRRRFDGDDTLEDVLFFIGAHGSQILEKLTTKEWALVDTNRYPLLPIDCEANKSSTLQFIGCWPSGKLEILPNKEEWLSNRSFYRGDSRGLGSAPSDIV